MEEPTCDYAADLTFILDSSDSISPDDYRKQKSLIISIARSFGISYNTSRAAVILYSDSASVHFQLGDSSSTREFEKAVHKMPHKKGPATIEKAFDVAITDVLPYGRAGIPQIAFVVTNGKHASEEGLKALDVSSTQLRSTGVKVISLGVGRKVDSNELRLMVNDEELLLRANSYDDLILERKNLSRKICQEAGKFKSPGTQNKHIKREVKIRPNYQIPWKNLKFPTLERENKLLTPKKYHYLTYTLKQLPTHIPNLINKVSTSSHSIVK